MTRWSDYHTFAPNLKGRKFFKEPGQYTYGVPAGGEFMVARALGCGGQGDHWGGGGAYARAIAPVTPGDTLTIQVGHTATAGIPGDSWVKLPSGLFVVYADRGRGSGAPGQAANCIGDLTRDGQYGVNLNAAGYSVGGAAATEAADYANLGLGSYATTSQATTPGFSTYSCSADYGGGGHGYSTYDLSGNWVLMAAYPAGTGLVGLEFFDGKPFLN